MPQHTKIFSVFVSSIFTKNYPYHHETPFQNYPRIFKLHVCELENGKRCLAKESFHKPP